MRSAMCWEMATKPSTRSVRLSHARSAAATGGMSGRPAAPLDDGGHAAGDVQERVERRLGEELAEHLEAALAAAHAGEPVVPESDARRAAGRAAPHAPRQRRMRCRQ